MTNTNPRITAAQKAITGATPGPWEVTEEEYETEDGVAQPSWVSAEAWSASASEAQSRGERPTIGPICRDCLRLVPRDCDPQQRISLLGRFCTCGHRTTVADDYAAHGIEPWVNPTGHVTDGRCQK